MVCMIPIHGDSQVRILSWLLKQKDMKDKIKYNGLYHGIGIGLCLGIVISIVIVMIVY